MIKQDKAARLSFLRNHMRQQNRRELALPSS
jgi:hypothetical protein